MKIKKLICSLLDWAFRVGLGLREWCKPGEIIVAWNLARKGNIMPTNIRINNESQVKVFLAPKTKHGKLATIIGKPAWLVVSGTCTLQPADDGLSCLIVSGENGDSQIAFDVQIDQIGERKVFISDFIIVTVTDPLAATIEVIVADPEDKPVDEPVPAPAPSTEPTLA